MKKKIALLVGLLLIVQQFLLCTYSIMTYEEYAQTRHSLSYIFQITHQKQHLYYFGANHSCDPADHQYPLLDTYWNNFLTITGGQDCVVLVEGSLRPLRSTAQEAIRSSGEGSYITFLAYACSIPVECPEPDSSSQVAALLQEFSEEEVLYAFGARAALSAIRESKVRNCFSNELFIESALQRYGSCFQLPLTVTKLKDIHKKLFDVEFNLSDENFFYSIINPVRTDTVINRVCRKNSILRDQHIVQFIERLWRAGKNVFVVYGVTHAIMQERALRSLFK